MAKLRPMHIIPDTHIPFHDKRAWALNLKVIADRQPECVIILGDFADFYSVSSHQKSPKHRNLLLQNEVAAVNKELDRLDKAIPRKARKIFISGNHCWRLDRYIEQRAPELFGMANTAELFGLKARGWEFVPYHSHIKVGKVYFTHDTGKSGASAHIAAERTFSDNAVIGHTHRMSYTIAGNATGAPHVAAMFGWLGDINAAEYMHLINARRDWTLGFGTGWARNDGVMYLQPHPVVEYTACVDGKLYTA